jgi:hypothetical protein
MKKKTETKSKEENYRIISIEQFMEIVSKAKKKSYTFDVRNALDIENVNFIIKIKLEVNEAVIRTTVLHYGWDDDDWEESFIFNEIRIDLNEKSIDFYNNSVREASVFIIPPCPRTVPPESLLG